MGLALWAASALVAFFIARIIPAGRRRAWVAEAIAAVVVGLLLGGVATALDFGGWNTADWRAALFVFFGALAAAGVVRGVTMRR